MRWQHNDVSRNINPLETQLGIMAGNTTMSLVIIQSRKLSVIYLFSDPFISTLRMAEGVWVPYYIDLATASTSTCVWSK